MSVAAVTALGVGAAFGATVSGWGPGGSGAAADGAAAPADGAEDEAPTGGTGGGGAAGLPVTTSAVGGIVILGVGLAGAGTALLVVRRRRAMGELTEP